MCGRCAYSDRMRRGTEGRPGAGSGLQGVALAAADLYGRVLNGLAIEDGWQVLAGEAARDRGMPLDQRPGRDAYAYAPSTAPAPQPISARAAGWAVEENQGRRPAGDLAHKDLPPVCNSTRCQHTS